MLISPFSDIDSKNPQTIPLEPSERVVIVTDFFPNELSGAGPWSERFKGLYYKIFQNYSFPPAKACWYSVRDKCLHSSDRKDHSPTTISMCRFLVREFANVRGKKTTVLILTYPLFRGREFLRSLFLIIALKILTWSSKFRFCLDFLEPPLLMPEVASKDTLIKTITYTVLYLQEKAYLKAANQVITGGDEMSNYLKQKYSLYGKAFSAIAQGVTVSDFPLTDRKLKADPFTLFYGGTLTKERGADRLFECVDSLNASYPIKLVCCGKIDGGLELPEKSWLMVYANLSYNEYVNLITTVADVAILPYPVNDWWGKISISKVATYAAAGLPILSTSLPHTANFLEQWECGLVANTWEEMKGLVVRLYEEPDLCNQLGKNARRAAESCLDWGVLVPELSHIVSRFSR